MRTSLSEILTLHASQRPILAQNPEDLAREIAERLTKPASVELLTPAVQCEFIDQVLEGTRHRWAGNSYPAKSDGFLAPLIHASLRISPRTAAHRGFWLSLAHRPLVAEYLFARWRPKEDVMPALNHLNGDNTHQGLARLWWMAELLRDGPDYSFVERGFEDQNVPNQAFRSLYFYSRPFARAFVELVLEYHDNKKAKHEKGKRVDQSAKAVNAALGTVLLETICVDGTGGSTDWKAWTSTSPTADEVKAWLAGKSPVGPQGGVVSQADLRRARRWMDEFYREWDSAAFEG
jgi:hypothetical protein